MVDPKKIKFPVSTEDIKGLSAGDNVLISGEIVTARDKAHEMLYNERPDRSELPFDLEGALIYHCGPIVETKDKEHRIVAFGPTTSIRLEAYEAWVIENYGVKGIMGKGGMGKDTLTALREYGAAYFHAIGGAASYLAEKVVRIADVYKLDEFGMPEAMWLIQVRDFPAIVTMDPSGKSLHDSIRSESEKIYNDLISNSGE
ncbi:MAG: fumarate hydratase C-terminal domain-containing protein [Nitrospirota bacterium]|nr:MAG: fumarate hydratase C-terminal domain-containing protein [Nitrospirota bacterium]